MKKELYLTELSFSNQKLLKKENGRYLKYTQYFYRQKRKNIKNEFKIKPKIIRKSISFNSKEWKFFEKIKLKYKLNNYSETINFILENINDMDLKNIKYIDNIEKYKTTYFSSNELKIINEINESTYSEKVQNLTYNYLMVEDLVDINDCLLKIDLKRDEKINIKLNYELSRQVKEMISRLGSINFFKLIVLVNTEYKDEIKKRNNNKDFQNKLMI